MDRDIPNFNYLITAKINQKNQQLHSKRIQDIRSSTASRVQGSSSVHNRPNSKACQLQQQKKTQIQKNNVILFNKMIRIMKRPDPCNRPPTQIPRSNRSRMSMEMNRIQQQNRTMYERIEKQRPTINNKRLFEDRRKNLNILKFLGKYSSHSIQSSNAQNLRYSQASSRFSGMTAQRKKIYTKQEHYLQDTNTEGQMATIRQNSQKIQMIGREEDQFLKIQRMIQQKKASREHFSLQGLRVSNQEMSKLPMKHGLPQKSKVPQTAKEIILFKKNQVLDGDEYEVKVVRKHLNYQIRCSLANTFSSVLKLVLDEKQGNDLLEEFNYDYAAIIKRLEINENNQLVLRDDQIPQNQQKIVQKQTNLKLNFNKFSQPQSAHNASHITELNEQQSAHIELIQGYGHRKTNLKQYTNEASNDLDSLGQQQLFDQAIELGRQVCEKDIPQNTQQNEQQKQSRIFVNQIEPNAIKEAQSQEKIYNNVQQAAPRHFQASLAQGLYQQALEEQIL